MSSRAVADSPRAVLRYAVEYREVRKKKSRRLRRPVEVHDPLASSSKACGGVAAWAVDQGRSNLPGSNNFYGPFSGIDDSAANGPLPRH